MKFWPLPDSYDNFLPRKNSKGSFWEDRGDRYNAGIDIYTPENSILLAVEDGVVIDIDKFTDSSVPFLNDTFYLIIKSPEKINYKYCELSNIKVTIGEQVKAGQEIAQIKSIINKEGVNDSTPYYIKELIYENYLSKLHLEMYKAPFTEIRPYEFGNFLGDEKPNSIIDPNVYFMGVKKVANA